MKEWNNNFDMKRKVNDKNIIVDQQDFENNTVLIKEESGNIVECPMYITVNGNIYFEYDEICVYMSDYMGEFIINK